MDFSLLILSIVIILLILRIKKLGFSTKVKLEIYRFKVSK